MTVAISSTRPAAELDRMVYRVLAEIFLFPDDERMTALVVGAPELRRRSEPLRDAPWFTAWDTLLDALEALDDDGVAELRDRYTILFLSGARGRSCPPFASAHWPGRTRDAAAIVAAVERAYAGAGFASIPCERPDAIAVELEFLAALCAERADADAAGADRWESRERSFVAHHLLPWLPAFAEALNETAAGSLYALAADATLAFCSRRAPLAAGT
jgi:TorA maturation chaperone TorD